MSVRNEERRAAHGADQIRRPPVPDLTEKAWQAQVIDLARLLGWSHQFTYRSKHSPAGWPDLALWRERFLVVELKRTVGKLSPRQADVLRELMAAGVETYIARPADLDDLAAILQARAPRWNALAGGATPRALEAYERLSERTRREVGV